MTNKGISIHLRLQRRGDKYVAGIDCTKDDSTCLGIYLERVHDGPFIDSQQYRRICGQALLKIPRTARGRLIHAFIKAHNDTWTLGVDYAHPAC